MFKHRLKGGDYFLIAVNLVPLFGVWFRGWDPKQMFLIYCLETVIIGFYNIIKMAIVTLYKKKDIWENNGSKMLVTGWFFIFFFILHYGFFVVIQMTLFGGVSGFSDRAGGGMFGFILNLPSLITEDSKLVLYGFAAIYGVRVMTDFILPGVYRNISLGLLMFQPYLRIFVQQFVVILGSIFLQFGGGKIFMLIFVIIKIYFELFINFDKIIEKAQRESEEKNLNKSIKDEP